MWNFTKKILEIINIFRGGLPEAKNDFFGRQCRKIVFTTSWFVKQYYKYYIIRFSINSLQRVYNFLTYVFSTYKREPFFNNEWTTIICPTLPSEKIYLKKTLFVKPNKYIYLCGFDDNTINVLFPKLSKICFLAVQYTHPKLKEPIDITVPSSYFVLGNKLYSSTFVLRSLQYQPKYYIFDENYTLQIIDNEINTFEIKSNQYIYIEENSYKILTLI